MPSPVLALGDFEAFIQALIGLIIIWFWAVTFLVVFFDSGTATHKILWWLVTIPLPGVSLALYFLLRRRTRRLQ